MATIWSMARQQVLVQLNDVLIQGLAHRSERTGQTRSEIIRLAIERHIDDDLEAVIDDRLVAGYAAIPPDAIDEWGSFAPSEWLVNDDRWGSLETPTEPVAQDGPDARDA